MKNSIYAIRGVFVQVFAGTDIKTAIEDAIKLADNSNNEVVFNFNGTLIQVDKNSIVSDKLTFYHNSITKNK